MPKVQEKKTRFWNFSVPSKAEFEVSSQNGETDEKFGAFALFNRRNFKTNGDYSGWKIRLVNAYWIVTIDEETQEKTAIGYFELKTPLSRDKLLKHLNVKLVQNSLKQKNLKPSQKATTSKPMSQKEEIHIHKFLLD
jgi:hypothetical protein